MLRNLAIAAAATGGFAAVYYIRPIFVKTVSSAVTPTPDYHAMWHAPHPALVKGPPAPKVFEITEEDAEEFPHHHTH